MESKGEVSNERKEKLEMLQSNYERLITSTQSMSDLLNEPMPELPKDEQVQTGGVVLEADDSSESQLDPWGDEETQSFYVDLPDLRVFLPNYAPKVQNVQPEEPTISEEVLDMEIGPEQLEVDESAAPPEDSGKSTTPEPIIPEEPAASTGDKTSGGGHGGHATRQQFSSFLNNLANCVNKELIDSAAIDFLLNLNTKNSRKKLTSTIFGVQRYSINL